MLELLRNNPFCDQALVKCVRCCWSSWQAYWLCCFLLSFSAMALPRKNHLYQFSLWSAFRLSPLPPGSEMQHLRVPRVVQSRSEIWEPTRLFLQGSHPAFYGSVGWPLSSSLVRDVFLIPFTSWAQSFHPEPDPAVAAGAFLSTRE